MPSRYAKRKTQRAGEQMAETSDSAATGAGQKLYLEVFLNLPLQSSFFYSVQMPHIPANAPENTLSEPMHTLDTSANLM